LRDDGAVTSRAQTSLWATAVPSSVSAAGSAFSGGVSNQKPSECLAAPEKRPGSPQSWHFRQNAGLGRVQVEHSGSVRVPPRTGRSWPRFEHVAQRWRQAVRGFEHLGYSVTLTTAA
jgi:hypothetical protein